MSQKMQNQSATIAEEFAMKADQQQRKEKILNRSPLIILAVLVMFFSITIPGSFLTFGNFKTILNQLSITLIIAIGLTFVTLIGAVDLSVDGVVALGGCLLSVLVKNSKYATDLGVWGLLLALAAGLAFGAVSGLIHVKLKISSFMVTYATCSIATGLAIMSYGGLFASIKDEGLLSIATSSFLTIPVVTWIALAMLVIALFIQKRTAFGAYMYAVGADESVPRMCGINVDRVKVLVFTFSGLCMALAGCLAALRLGSGVVDIGTGQFFPAMAAVIVGGTSLSGGKGGVLNTFVGALIITVLNVGLLLFGVNTYIRQGVQGVIIVAAVALTIQRSRRTIVN